MQIGTGYNVTTPQQGVTLKAKNEGPSDKVTLGGNETDNTLSMANQLKDMKAFDGQLFGSMLEHGVDTCVGAVGGAAVGAIGTAIVSNIAGVGGWGTLGLSLLGGAAGTVAGGVIGYHHADHH
jgi:hypothetical protein